jgi:predicted house-cleaning noncanonical NTP pyrophosphatase (MazG superfamily)/8-oxo-dGTP pyrophosphatase MutT (NUDIX family)
MKYNKLVRDKIPEIIKKDNKNPVFHTANETEYKIKLYEKLSEETEELKKSHSKEELADVLEVIDSIIKLEKFSKEEITKLKQNKLKQRGSFKKRIILDEVNNFTDHAAIIIKNKDNKILFIKRSMNKKTLPGVYSFPSGTKKENETINQTAIREAKEELDLNLKIIKTIATQKLPEFNVRLNFILSEVTNQIPKIIATDEIDSYIWMTFEEFFNIYSDDNIGHGLVWLRKNPDVYTGIL